MKSQTKSRLGKDYAYEVEYRLGYYLRSDRLDGKERCPLTDTLV